MDVNKRFLSHVVSVEMGSLVALSSNNPEFFGALESVKDLSNSMIPNYNHNLSIDCYDILDDPESIPNRLDIEGQFTFDSVVTCSLGGKQLETLDTLKRGKKTSKDNNSNEPKKGVNELGLLYDIYKSGVGDIQFFIPGEKNKKIKGGRGRIAISLKMACGEEGVKKTEFHDYLEEALGDTSFLRQPQYRLHKGLTEPLLGELLLMIQRKAKEKSGHSLEFRVKYHKDFSELSVQSGNVSNFKGGNYCKVGGVMNIRSLFAIYKSMGKDNDIGFYDTDVRGEKWRRSLKKEYSAFCDSSGSVKQTRLEQDKEASFESYLLQVQRQFGADVQFYLKFGDAVYDFSVQQTYRLMFRKKEFCRVNEEKLGLLGAQWGRWYVGQELRRFIVNYASECHEDCNEFEILYKFLKQYNDKNGIRCNHSYPYDDIDPPSERERRADNIGHARNIRDLIANPRPTQSQPPQQPAGVLDKSDVKKTYREELLQNRDFFISDVMKKTGRALDEILKNTVDHIAGFRDGLDVQRGFLSEKAVYDALVKKQEEYEAERERLEKFESYDVAELEILWEKKRKLTGLLEKNKDAILQCNWGLENKVMLSYSLQCFAIVNQPVDILKELDLGFDSSVANYSTSQNESSSGARVLTREPLPSFIAGAGDFVIKYKNEIKEFLAGFSYDRVSNENSERYEPNDSFKDFGGTQSESSSDNSNYHHKFDRSSVKDCVSSVLSSKSLEPELDNVLDVSSGVSDDVLSLVEAGSYFKWGEEKRQKLENDSMLGSVPLAKLLIDLKKELKVKQAREGDVAVNVNAISKIIKEVEYVKEVVDKKNCFLFNCDQNSPSLVTQEDFQKNIKESQPAPSGTMEDVSSSPYKSSECDNQKS